MLFMNNLYEIAQKNLKSIWGFESFREGQNEAVQSILSGKDTLVLFPTGGGKSLCYQVPATVLEGLTVVISPLMALMKDQVDHLNHYGVDATFLNSSLSNREIEQRLINARNGMYKLLYCSPERLQSPAWQYEMNQLQIDFIAIDEAHCISEWGHDFRPAYRSIRDAFAALNKPVRWMALTATATPEVREDIINELGLEDPKIISTGFDRSNLKWWVIETHQKKKKLMQMVKRAEGQSGLIYAGTRRIADELAEYLVKAGYKATSYHAGIDSVNRNKIQHKWLNGEFKWIVATSAFGMGIDKSDCRFVIHYMMPQSLEAYYQEAGRAGRDGAMAYPVLLYNQSDYARLKKMIMDSYPQREVLQKVYDAICDRFQLAIGSQMENPEEVDLADLSKRNGLPEKAQLAGLHMLQKIGILNIVTHYEPEVGVRFIMSYEGILEHLQKLSNQAKKNFIENLFRLFGPESLNTTVYLEISSLQKKLDITKNSLIKGLEILNREQILLSKVRENNPMVHLNDVRMDRLPFSNTELLHYRDVLLKKLDYMLGYIKTEHCRGIYLSHYFGEKTSKKRCNHCDLCEAKHPKAKVDRIRAADFELIRKLLDNHPRKFHYLVQETGWEVEKLKRVLKILLKENKIVSKSGEPDVFYLFQKD